MQTCRVWLFSGGTLVTVQGSNLNSVAAPRITLTVIITRFDSNTTSMVWRYNFTCSYRYCTHLYAGAIQVTVSEQDDVSVMHTDNKHSWSYTRMDGATVLRMGSVPALESWRPPKYDWAPSKKYNCQVWGKQCIFIRSKYVYVCIHKLFTYLYMHTGQTQWQNTSKNLLRNLATVIKHFKLRNSNTVQTVYSSRLYIIEFILSASYGE